jgi:hypothetical protein
MDGYWHLQFYALHDYSDRYCTKPVANNDTANTIRFIALKFVKLIVNTDRFTYASSSTNTYSYTNASS